MTSDEGNRRLARTLATQGAWRCAPPPHRCRRRASCPPVTPGQGQDVGFPEMGRGRKLDLSDAESGANPRRGGSPRRPPNKRPVMADESSSSLPSTRPTRRPRAPRWRHASATALVRLRAGMATRRFLRLRRRSPARDVSTSGRLGTPVQRPPSSLARHGSTAPLRRPSRDECRHLRAQGDDRPTCRHHQIFHLRRHRLVYANRASTSAATWVMSPAPSSSRRSPARSRASQAAGQILARGVARPRARGEKVRSSA